MLLGSSEQSCGVGAHSVCGCGEWAAGRGEECRQKRERREGRLQMTTCHFKEFGLRPEENLESSNGLRKGVTLLRVMSVE